MEIPASPPSPGPVAFSTVGLPQEQRIALWESHNSDALIGLRCRTLSSDVLEATEINLQVDRVHLARVRGNSHVVERDAKLIEQQPADAIALYFNLVGEAFFYHPDGVRTLQPGQLLICDADRPFMRGFSHGLEELVLKVPRTLFSEVTGIGRLDQPQVVNFTAGSNAVAHSLARAVGRSARHQESAAVDEKTLLDLVAALAGGTEQDRSLAHRIAAQAYVEQHLFDPSLSAQSVARAIGLSNRHLSRIFAELGGGFPGYLQRRRLESAKAILESPAGAETAIADLARRCGFTSAAHFSHAFSKHFDETASEVRRRAAARSPDRPGPPSPARPRPRPDGRLTG